MSVTVLLWVLLVWLAVSVALLVACHGRTLVALWREPMLAYPVLIVESDDWGVGPPSDGDMLARIAGLLREIQDGTGHPAVMTLGVVLGAPNGAAILASGCQGYQRHTLAEPAYGRIVEAIRDGCESGVFALQRHGLEHCWPPSLLARARADEALQSWLADPMARSEALPSALQSRWLDTSSLPSRTLPAGEVEQAVQEEAALFLEVFGRVPTVAVPNTFVWDETVEAAWAATGVRCVVTPGKQFCGRDAGGNLGRPQRTIRNGQRSSTGMTYVVRDDYFEPIRGHRAEDVWRAVAGKTFVGRPALLETHRESFIAARVAGIGALGELDRALRGTRERHPRLRFLSTEALVQALWDPASPLLESSIPRRTLAFLRRLRVEPGLGRFLKLTGLGGLAWVSAMLLTVVTGDRSDSAIP